MLGRQSGWPCWRQAWPHARPAQNSP